MKELEKYALKTLPILLPNQSKVDLTKWSVLACDQYTQSEDYWKSVKQIISDKYSTLNLILPEVYLNKFSTEEKEEYTKNVHYNMNKYLSDGVFNTPLNSILYIERKTEYNRLRKGLITCIDLEKYSWELNSNSEIRSSEATILDRVPPRLHIREGAKLETPHIMLLLNDPDNFLIEETGKFLHKENIQPLYDFDLMMNSGHISGWEIPQNYASNNLKEAFEKNYQQNTNTDGSTCMFVVGDGNHSLAAAKLAWNQYKEKNGGVKNDNGEISIPKNLENSPLRYALVEIINLYDEGLNFEPIHRTLFNVNEEDLLDFVQIKLEGSISICNDKEEMLETVLNSSSAFGFVSNKLGFVCLKTKIDRLAISALQPILDEFIPKTSTMDFIHGADEAIKLAKKDKVVSIIIPPISKDHFFSTIAEYGSLPRKSFSMGEASEKRFYLECRKLI